MTTPDTDQLRAYAQKTTRLAQASMTALMGIADMKTHLLNQQGDTVPVGHVLRMLDALQLDIIKCRVMDE